MNTTEILNLVLKISLVFFMAGNLMEMGLKLNPGDAMKGLKNIPFVVYTIFWGFIVGPALAYGITLILPLAKPYAIGLILFGMTPCAPFVPMFVNKAKGDVGYTAAFMLLVAVVTIIIMPFAVPFMVEGLTVSAWDIARPLLIMILIPLLIGMLILYKYPVFAGKMKPVVKKVTGVFTLITAILIIIIYGEGFLSVAGQYAVLAQVLFFGIMTFFTYWFGFGLKYEQRIILSIGMSTRNLGAAIAPLFSVAEMDQRAFIMIVLGLPIMVLFALLSVKVFKRK